jgi:chromosome segregation ATPase
MTDTKNAYVRQMEAQLEMWKAEMDKFAAQTKQMSAEAQADAENRYAAIKAQATEAEERLNELRNAGQDAWQDMARGTELSIIAMRDAIKSATQRLAS